MSRNGTNDHSGTTNSLLALPEEVLKHIASQLYTPSQLFALALSCKRFKQVVEGAARTFIDVSATEAERSNLPRVILPATESDTAVAARSWGVLAQYYLILNHRESLRFNQIVGDVELTEGDTSRVCTVAARGAHYSTGAGSSNRRMRSGVHKAVFEFNCDVGEVVAVGIARPVDYNNERMYANRRQGVLWFGHSYGPETLLCGARERGRRLPPHVFNRDDRVGFILDMDNRTLTLCRNGNPVDGVISNLTGEYVWVAHIERGRRVAAIRICDWE